MKNERFHAKAQTYQEYERRSIEKAIQDGRITQKDASLISDFVAETAITNRLSSQRRFKMACALCTVARYLPGVNEMTTGSVYNGLAALSEARKSNGQPYTQNSKADFFKFAKRYLLYLAENGHISVPIEKIRKIKTPGFKDVTKTADDILTEEEMKALVDAARSTRYKALIAIMYEGGFRAGEIASMQWKDVTFYDWGVRITTDGKTEFPRSVPIVVYQENLARWKASYPGNPTGEAFVFVNMHGKPLQYRGLAKALENFAKAAGIQKRVTPHILRHSRITHALRNGLQETIAKKTFWGNMSTAMISTYGHLVDEDSTRAFAALAGVDIPDTRRSTALDPIQCTGCHTVNPPGSDYCNRCGLPLTEEARLSQENVVAEIERVLQRPAGINPSGGRVPSGYEILAEALARIKSSQPNP